MTLEQIIAKYEMYRKNTSKTPSLLAVISLEERELIKDVYNKYNKTRGEVKCR